MLWRLLSRGVGHGLAVLEFSIRPTPDFAVNLVRIQLELVRDPRRTFERFCGFVDHPMPGAAHLGPPPPPPRLPANFSKTITEDWHLMDERIGVALPVRHTEHLARHMRRDALATRQFFAMRITADDLGPPDAIAADPRTDLAQRVSVELAPHVDGIFG